MKKWLIIIAYIMVFTYIHPLWHELFSKADGPQWAKLIGPIFPAVFTCMLIVLLLERVIDVENDDN
jgi:hypothetical protein